MPSPEDQAREEIDALLERGGWQVQDKSSVNLQAARGVAVRELSFKTGEPDYTLKSHSRPSLSRSGSWRKWSGDCRWLRNSKLRWRPTFSAPRDFAKRFCSGRLAVVCLTVNIENTITMTKTVRRTRSVSKQCRRRVN